MLNEIDAGQLQAVKEFANGLLECFEAKKKNKTKDIYLDEVSELYMNYCIKTIHLHLELFDIKFERYVNNLEAYKNKEKVLDNKN